MKKLYFSGLYSRQTFLIVGTLLLPVSPLLCVLLYFGAALVSGLKWKQVIFKRERLVILGSIAFLCLGIISRKVKAENFLPGAVALSDYIPFLLFFFLISLKPFSKLEIEGFCYALIATIPQQFIIAIFESNLNGRFYFFNEKMPIFDLYFVPSFVRASAGFFNPNIFACYCVFCGVVALGLLIYELEKIKLYTQKESFIYLRILVVFIGLILCIKLLLWSGSDAGIITFFVTSLILLGWITGKFVYLAISSFTCAVFLLIASKAFPILISVSQSFTERVPFYNCAIQLIEEKPFMGWGIGTFASECSARTGQPMAHAHNIVLQLGTDIGIIFTILFLGFVGYLLFVCFSFFLGKRLRKRLKYSLYVAFFMVAISTGVMQFFDLALLMSYRLNFLFWICLAIPYSLISQSKCLALRSHSKSLHHPA
ncbi:MAG: O-antigen ligase family protein [Coleofasciculus sp. S288]|nr:O-antigen ligase family protein [Coleofasciculus sp. S288]